MSAILSSLRHAFDPPAIAIDLGTANTRLYSDGEVVEKQTMVRRGRRPVTDDTTLSGNPSVLFPMRRGFVVNVAAAAELLTPLVADVRGTSLRKPRAIACLPSTASVEQRDALVSALHGAGVSGIVTVPEPLAAAVGAGIEVSSGYAQLLVDIGDGITELAVIRSGQIVRSASIPIACSDLRKAVKASLRDVHDFTVANSEADSILRHVAGAEPAGVMTVKLSPSFGGKEIAVETSALRDAICRGAEPILSFVDGHLRCLSDKASAEVIENGLWVTGGGAALDLLIRLLESRTRLDVRRPANPLLSVIDGASRMIAVAGSTATVWH